MTRVIAALALSLALGACEEDLTVPGGCPEACPGARPTIEETVLAVLADGDSTHFGYAGHRESRFLPVSDGLEAGEARAWYRFAARPDSVFVVDVFQPYTIDSVVFTMPLAARDTLATNLRIILHRIAITVDTLIDFADLEEQLTAATLIDSILVPDTVRSGVVQVTLRGDDLSRIEIPEEDDGLVAIGVRVRADRPTGVRLGSMFGGTGIPTFVTHAFVDVQDTTRQRHVVTVNPELNGFVSDTARAIDPDLLYLGGIPAARTLLRFDVPPAIRDSAVLLRATLELTPAAPLWEIPNVVSGIEARAVAADFGAKSTLVFAFTQFRAVGSGTEGSVEIEVRPILETWRGSQGLPSMIHLSLTPEVGSLMLPSFLSSRSPAGGPRLRITYMIPGVVERP